MQVPSPRDPYQTIESDRLCQCFTGRDASGKRRYLNKTIRGTKKDADAYLSKTLTAMSTGTFVEPSKLTVTEYLDKWLTVAAKPRLRERTFEEYSEKLNRYVRPLLGRKNFLMFARWMYSLSTAKWQNASCHHAQYVTLTP